MAIFQITTDRIVEVSETSFSAEGIKERDDLQRLLRDQIEVIVPDTLIIAEEFGDWEDSKRRIDLLGVDRDANLVVIELKRTEDGGHMELQAIRYAAMVSTMTFEKAVEVFSEFLKGRNREGDARSALLHFLEWEAPNDDRFNNDVRIVLVSAEFSKELTTAVLWLMDHDIDIQCVRIKPYRHASSILIDVQQVIPLPEANAYQVQLREKLRKERVARESSKDLTKFDVIINGESETGLAKRQAILRIVRHLCEAGIAPEAIARLLPWKGKGTLFQSADGNLDEEAFVTQVISRRSNEGKEFDPKRYFCDSDDLIHFGQKTFAFTSQWGARTAEAMRTLMDAFPDRGVTVNESKLT